MKHHLIETNKERSNKRINKSHPKTLLYALGRNSILMYCKNYVYVCFCFSSLHDQLRDAIAPYWYVASMIH